MTIVALNVEWHCTPVVGQGGSFSRFVDRQEMRGSSQGNYPVKKHFNGVSAE